MYYEKLTDLGIKLTRRGGQEKTKCPQCSDGRKNKHDKPLSVSITTGEYHCHNCGWKGNVRSFLAKRDYKTYEKPPQDVMATAVLKEEVVRWFAGRGVSQRTLEKFMVFVKKEWMPQTQAEENCVCFPYFRDGEIVNIKYRDARKNFKMHKGAELILYNLQTMGNKKHCIITEGEIDCMSAYEAGFSCEPSCDEQTGEVSNEEFSKWCLLSVPNGASSGEQKLSYLDNCAEYLIGLHEVIVATDGDEAGDRLRDELVRRLGVERCKTISYPIEEVVPKEGGKRRCKDLNEVLQYLGADAVVNVIKNASSIPVEGVYEIDDLFPSMIENFKRGIQLAPTTRFPEQDNFWRWKKGDLNLFTGYANWGKTMFALQMMLTKSIWDGWKWAVFCPENYPANDFYDDLVEMYVGKWLDKMTEQEYTDACHFIGRHIFYVYPEDEHDIISIHEKFRYLVLKKGIDGVLVDPFNQLDHTQKAYQREDQYLSQVLKDMKRFALLNSIVYNVIAHPKNPDMREGRVLPVVDMYDIHGGSMWGNKVDLILSYHRPRFHEDKNSTEVEIYVQKLKRKRTGGKLGSYSINLDWSKKRYVDSITQKAWCDHDLASRELKRLEQGYTQSAISQGAAWLPYKDEGDNEIGF